MQTTLKYGDFYLLKICLFEENVHMNINNHMTSYLCLHVCVSNVIPFKLVNQKLIKRLEFIFFSPML